MLLNEKKNHYLRAGLVLTGLMAALALLGCVWTPYPPTAMSGSEKFAAPCLRHLFGTDNFGRDIFSRVLKGAGTTYGIALCTVAVGAVCGTVLGAVTGYFGGIVDDVLMRLGDVLTAFPSILLALVVISFVLSFACEYLPGISALSGGTRTIILTVAISAAAAVLFPVKQEADHE